MLLIIFNKMISLNSADWSSFRLSHTITAFKSFQLTLIERFKNIHTKEAGTLSCLFPIYTFAGIFSSFGFLTVNVILPLLAPIVTASPN